MWTGNLGEKIAASKCSAIHELNYIAGSEKLSLQLASSCSLIIKKSVVLNTSCAVLIILFHNFLSSSLKVVKVFLLAFCEIFVFHEGKNVRSKNFLLESLMKAAFSFINRFCHAQLKAEHWCLLLNFMLLSASDFFHHSRQFKCLTVQLFLLFNVKSNDVFRLSNRKFSLTSSMHFLLFSTFFITPAFDNFRPSQIQYQQFLSRRQENIARDKRKVSFFMDYKQTFPLAYGVRAAKTFCVDTLINNTFNYSENALSNCQIIAKLRHKGRE